MGRPCGPKREAGHYMFLFSTALLLTSMSPSPGEPGAGARVTALKVKLEAAEDRFEDSIKDLYSLDVCGTARAFDWDLRVIEHAALELETALVDEESFKQLKRCVLDEIEYSRFRLRQFESAGIGAQELVTTLCVMRRARADGRQEMALLVHQRQVGDQVPEEQAPFILRRLSAALSLERRRAEGPAETMAQPR